jgi:hypothetical protein
VNISADCVTNAKARFKLSNSFVNSKTDLTIPAKTVKTPPIPKTANNSRPNFTLL